MSDAPKPPAPTPEREKNMAYQGERKPPEKSASDSFNRSRAMRIRRHKKR